MGAYPQLLRQDLPVPLRLGEKHHEIAVLEDVLDLPGGKEVLHVLGQGAGDAALFAEHLPDGHEIAGSQLVLQQHMELVIVAPGGNAPGEIVGDLAVHQVVDDVHGYGAEARPQPFQIKAHHPGVLVAHVGLVVEDVQGAGNIDFKGRRQPFGLRFRLLAEKVIEVLQGGEGRMPRGVEEVPVHHPGAPVNDGPLHRLQPILASHNELHQGEDEIAF